MVNDTYSSRRAWSTVVGSTLSLVVAQAPVTVFSFGLFIEPLNRAFGWGRGTISLASGVAFILSALSVPFFGVLMDRVGVKRVLIWTIIIFALSMMLVGLSGAHAWQFILLYAMVGLISSGQSPIGYVKAISGHFDRNRGLALGIGMAGIGIGSILVPQYVALFIRDYGWRMAFFALGALLLLVPLPSVIALVHETSGTDEATREPLVGIDLMRAARLRSFWLIVSITLLVSLSLNGVVVHLVPLLTDGGLSRGRATSILAVLGAATMFGRLLSGILFDRLFAPRVSAILFVLAALGIYLLSIDAAIPFALIGLGLGLGAEIDLIGYLTSRYFGLRHFGQVYGALFMIFSIGGACGPVLLGWSFDHYASYHPLLMADVVMLLVACLAALALGPYRFPSSRNTPQNLDESFTQTKGEDDVSPPGIAV